jgi:hypothetical protein
MGRKKTTPKVTYVEVPDLRGTALEAVFDYLLTKFFDEQAKAQPPK